MSRVPPRPLKVEQDFTDARLTGFRGWSALALALAAERLGLFRDLSEGVSVKVRRRGASDRESLWALVASFAVGGGALSDLDVFRADPAACRLLGLSHAPSGRLHPGGVHAAHGWRERMESDVAPLLPKGTPVWVRADNAHYSWDFAAFRRERGWDCSVSVTNPGFKSPVLAQADGLPESAWKDVSLCGQAALVRRHWESRARRTPSRGRCGTWTCTPPCRRLPAKPPQKGTKQQPLKPY